MKAKVIEKSGPWYSHNGVQIGQGREKTKQHLEQHPELAREIEKAVRDRLIIESSPIDEYLANEHSTPQLSTEKSQSNNKQNKGGGGGGGGISKPTSGGGGSSSVSVVVEDDMVENDQENTNGNLEEFSEDKS